MCKCANVQMCKCANVQMRKCANGEIVTYSNKHMRSFIVLFAAAIVAGCGKQASQPESLYSFSLDSIIRQSNGAVVWQESSVFKGKAMTFSSSGQEYSITLTSGADPLPWVKARYLVCEIMNNNPYSAIVYVDFYKRAGDPAEAGIVQQGGITTGEFPEQPRISPKVGILPFLKTKLVIPLSHLDGQDIFMDRFPRQLKGTVMGHRLEPADIGRVVIRVEPVLL